MFFHIHIQYKWLFTKDIDWIEMHLFEDLSKKGNKIKQTIDAIFYNTK